jgi:uncharacterized protein DUF5666
LDACRWILFAAKWSRMETTLWGKSASNVPRGRPAFIEKTDMPLVTKFAVGSLLLGGFVCAQVPSQPATSATTSAMVSSASPADSSIKPLPAAAPEPPPEPDIVVDPASLLPDLPSVPNAKATLIGGTVERLDRVRDQVTVRVFGGGRMNVLFDPRTHVYKGQTPGSLADLNVGQRIYLDTILDGNTVFARSIRLKNVQAVGESQGVVVKVRADRGELTVRDSISPSPVHVRLSSSTRFVQGGRTVPATALLEGSLVAMKFGAEGNGHEVAREISILALPGTRYVFTGQVLHIDLRTGLLVLNSSTDHKTYEISLDLSSAPDDNLQVGSVVTVITSFENSRYVARNVTINSQGR